uniref:Uncharacterized protein n=1 Tax=Cacopsylla melanoneura TaxID=428564 RepID=A0A8D8TP82_9HEMI
MCDNVSARGVFNYNGHILNFTKGEVLSTTIVTHGSKHDGKCSAGPPLTRDGITWYRPVRTTKITIEGSKEETTVDFEENQILLPQNVNCRYTLGECFHYSLGNVFWRTSVPECNDKAERAIIFKGHATSVERDDGVMKTTYIHVSQDDIEFQLQLISKTTNICGFKSYYTEHPKLFVTFVDDETYFPLSKKISDKSADLMLYINSKIVMVSRNTHLQFDRLYASFQLDRCVMEQKILDNY